MTGRSTGHIADDSILRINEPIWVVLPGRYLLLPRGKRYRFSGFGVLHEQNIEV
jgi:hypothetical protein